MKKRGERGRVRVLAGSRLFGFRLFLVLVVVNLILAGIGIAKARGFFIPEQSQPLVVEGVIDLDDLTLEQKIAQMIVGLGIEYYADPLKKMQLGGVHLHAMVGEEAFKKTINHFQEGMEIPFFITVDLEGCVNPFAAFRDFPSASTITTLGQAFEVGKAEGQFLKSMGIDVNFAPVVDLQDEIWNCRAFPGDEKNITELANAYILGLQDEGIIAVAKHYPGKTLVIKDPHKYLAAAEITVEDLYPYQELARKGQLKSVMISHLITFGKVNSEGKPSVASERIVSGLREHFPGLIITDEVNMLGLKNFYDTEEEMYLEVCKAGADLILNFKQDPNDIYWMIRAIATAVDEGKISEERIDDSVRKILEAKGLVVS